MENRKALISILNYNGKTDTIACIKSFYRYEDKREYSVVIWDNASEEADREQLWEELHRLNIKSVRCTALEYKNIDKRNYDLVFVVSEDNLGFAKGNNRVIEDCLDKFQYIILLNNDTEFIKASSSRLINYLEHEKNVSIASCSIYYYYNKSSIWNAGGRIFLGTRKYFTEKYVNRKLRQSKRIEKVDFITGCYLVVRSSLLKKYGLLTEKFFFGEEDYEFFMRMRKASVASVVLYDEKIYHKVGATINRNSNKEADLRKSFVHHLNRFIDMKSYYSITKWNIWRFFSCLYIYILLLKKKYPQKQILNYIGKLNRYARKRNSLDKEFFLEILNGKV